jgi:hypothetical protein
LRFRDVAHRHGRRRVQEQSAHTFLNDEHQIAELSSSLLVRTAADCAVD